MALFGRKSFIDKLNIASKTINELDEIIESIDNEFVSLVDSKVELIREDLKKIKELKEDDELHEYLDIKIEDIIGHIQLKVHGWYHGDHLIILDNLSDYVNQLLSNLEDHFVGEGKEIVDCYERIIKEHNSLKEMIESIKKIEMKKLNLKKHP